MYMQTTCYNKKKQLVHLYKPYFFSGYLFIPSKLLLFKNACFQYKPTVPSYPGGPGPSQLFNVAC